MNSELLIAHFNQISDAPDAVPRLRSFILELAVRGKLVEQDPHDEPASKLISRIEKKKSKLGLIGGTTKPGMELAAHDDVPFKIPSNWIWVRLGGICSKTGSGSTPRGGKSVYQPDGVPFLRSQNVYDDGLRLDDVAYISHQTHEKMSGTAVEPGDLLLNITGGSIGRCCLVSTGLGQANVSQHVAIIRVALDGIQRYLHQLVRSPYFQSLVLSEQTGAGRGGLPKNRMDRLPVALPPLDEQHRIVAKVDELMALCDRLEAAQQERENRRDLLTGASHHHLINGADTDALRKHAYFFIGHLPRLTARPDQIKQLRQTVLTLAIRGRLVPQNEADEPARELLKRLHAERARLVKSGEIKEEKALKKPLPDRKSFVVPRGWEWVTLSEAAFSFKYGTSVKCSYEATGEPVLRIPNIDNGRINVEDLKYAPLFLAEARNLRLRLGDVLMIRSNGSLNLVGRAAMVDPTTVGYCYAGYLVRVRTGIDFLDTRYLLIALSTQHLRDQIEIPIRTAVGLKNVNTTELSSLTFPLPPLSEQSQIATMVDELMTVCDHMEAQLTSIQTDTSRLLEAVLHRALTATVPVSRPELIANFM